MFEKLEDDNLKELRKQYGAPKEKVFALDLRVAKVLEVKEHSNADKLYILSLDVGEKRQIVSGLKEFYTAEELTGKNIILVYNMVSAKLRGVESQGMLLAASKSDKANKKEKVIVLEAPKSKPGDRVLLAGYKINHDQIKYEDFARLKLHIRGKKAVFDKKKLQTPVETVIADIEDGARVS